MQIRKEIVQLPSGEYTAELLFFEKKDRKILYDIYKTWVSLSKNLKKVHGRRINIPEGLSEAAFCLEMGENNIARFLKLINGKKKKEKVSFDCFNIENNSRIQVKASSVESDLTSFGPKSVWDELYFLDFYRNGKWDGSFDIYKIDNEDIRSMSVNKKETLEDQQKGKRRPRFSIIDGIIKPKHLKPIKTGYILK